MSRFRTVIPPPHLAARLEAVYRTRVLGDGGKEDVKSKQPEPETKVETPKRRSHPAFAARRKEVKDGVARTLRRTGT